MQGIIDLQEPNLGELPSDIISTFMAFQFLKKLWCCVSGRAKQKFGFIKSVD